MSQLQPSHMSFGISRALLTVAMTLFAGCTLPQAGPSLRSIATAEREGGPPVTSLTAEIVAQAETPRTSTFPAIFLAAKPIDVAVIVPGDVIAVTVFESADSDGLFGSAINPRTDIGEQIVDQSGRIMVPYIGLITVAGQRVEAIRAAIVRGLSKHTFDPQVVVRLGVRQGAMVTVQGIVAKPGAYPLETKLTRLVDLLAAAGVSEPDGERVKITVRRGEDTGTVRFADVIGDGNQDIALQPGDKVFLSRSRDTLTVLGAVGIQGRVEIPGRSFSLVDALASARGANDEIADPRGVFLFRQNAGGLGQLIYQVDMSSPAQLMLASRFQVRDGDAIYISNASFAQTKKVLTLLTATLNTTRFAGTSMP